MKRLSIVLSLVMMLGWMNSYAQSDENKLNIGVHGNSGLSWMSTKVKGYESNGPRFSYGYGLRIDYRFAKNYYIGSGVDMNYMGGKLSYPLNYKGSNDTMHFYGTMNRKYKIQYLDIPINLTLKTKEIGYFTYYVQIGYVTSIRINSYADDEYTYPNSNVTVNEEDVDIKKDFNFLKAGFNFGLGTEFNLNNNISFYGKVFYHSGVTDVLGGTNNVKNAAGVLEEIKEHALMNNVGISVGVMF